ncbi:hypothetical protein [Bradyrhizobium sp.]|uniref:hypothetical protein n=1 Tax=Bradyrhizobium sp. TaxID=376 RepID=UPI0025C02084|nr:hypothetical protein [Bradyrhizobium sp.]
MMVILRMLDAFGMGRDGDGVEIDGFGGLDRSDGVKSIPSFAFGEFSPRQLRSD